MAAWGPDGAAAPSYAQNPAAEAALDPGKVTRVAPTTWWLSARTDFSARPARGNLAGQRAAARPAPARPARPGRVRAGLGDARHPLGAPAGPPQLLYAGDVDQARGALLRRTAHRPVRRAARRRGRRGPRLRPGPRRDRGRGGSAGPGPADGNVRYLYRPLVTRAAEPANLMKPAAGHALTLGRGCQHATGRPCPDRHLHLVERHGGDRHLGACNRAPISGELIPAHLTSGPPAAPHEAAGPAALRNWAPFACSLAAGVRSQGVRSVNASAVRAAAAARRERAGRLGVHPGRHLAGLRHPGPGPVPHPGRSVRCDRGEGRELARVRQPCARGRACGKSSTGDWYLLAAGSKDTASISTTAG